MSQSLISYSRVLEIVWVGEAKKNAGWLTFLGILTILVDI